MMESIVKRLYAHADAAQPARDPRRRGRRGRRVTCHRVARAGRQPARVEGHASARVGRRRAAELRAQPPRPLAAARLDDGRGDRRARRRDGVLRRSAQGRAGAARGGGVPRARRQHGARRAPRARGDPDAGRPPRGRPDRRDLGRLRGHRRARGVLRQRAGGRRRGSGGAGERGRASRSSSSIWPRPTGTGASATSGPPDSAAARHAARSGRPRASGSRRSISPSGRAELPLPPDYVRTGDRESTERVARATALELLDARAARRRRSSPAPTCSPWACSGRRASAGSRSRRTWRSSRSTSRRSPTCSIRPSRRSTATTASSATAPPTCCSRRSTGRATTAARSRFERMPLALRPRRSCGCGG